MLTLQAPYASPTLTVTLPNPTFGDSVTQNLKTKFGFAMSGRIITTISTQPEKKLQYNWNKLKRTNVDALIAFFDLHAGSDIKLIDHTAVVWKVKCLSSPVEFTEDLNFYSCQLDFQGIKT